VKARVSVDNALKEHWEVTGDDGISQLSLILLRVMTTTFLALTAVFTFFCSGLIDVSNFSIKLQTLHMVGAFAIIFVLIGLGIAISMHPMFHKPPKILMFLAGIGYLIFYGLTNGTLPEWELSPFLFFPGLALLAACLAFLPISHLAWTTPPRITDD